MPHAIISGIVITSGTLINPTTAPGAPALANPMPPAVAYIPTATTLPGVTNLRDGFVYVTCSYPKFRPFV